MGAIDYEWNQDVRIAESRGDSGWNQEMEDRRWSYGKTRFWMESGGEEGDSGWNQEEEDRRDSDWNQWTAVHEEEVEDRRS